MRIGAGDDIGSGRFAFFLLFVLVDGILGKICPERREDSEGFFAGRIEEYE